MTDTEAVGAARAAVGWYGDPTISWSVLLRATIDSPADPAKVGERLAAMVRRYPHLGAVPAVEAADARQWPALLARFADEPYADGCPLVRVAIGTEEPVLVVAAHHGVTDGLGLLALLGEALGTTLTSAARGIGERAARSSFAVTAARRLVEALLRPPARIAPHGGSDSAAAAGDVLREVEVPAAPVGTGTLVAATARAVESWNRWSGTRTGRQVVGLGVSRRGGERLTPELDSAFVRLALPGDPSGATVRRMIAKCRPEPTYPHTRSAAPQAVTRALARRLGSTFLVSNLGRVQAAAGVRSLAFHPAASGRSGVAIGAVTAGAITTITIRARRSDFDDSAAGKLLDTIVDELELRR